jgi:2,4'-dihydroxyacetophenone dioxygenase
VMVVVMGAVEYISYDGVVKQRITTADRIADYRRWCESTGTAPLDSLFER